MKFLKKEDKLSNFLGYDVFSVEKDGRKYYTDGLVRSTAYGNYIDCCSDEACMIVHRCNVQEKVARLDNIGFLKFKSIQQVFDTIAQMSIVKLAKKAKNVEKYTTEDGEKFVKWKKYVFTDEDWEKIINLHNTTIQRIKLFNKEDYLMSKNKRRMTNQELYWWARTNQKGEVKYEDGDERTIWKDGTWSFDVFDKNKSDEPVDDCITIRSSKKGEWEEPLIGEDEEL